MTLGSLKNIVAGWFLPACLTLMGAGPAGAQINFQLLDLPVSCEWASFSLSADGSSMGCRLGGDIYWWTRSGGFRFVAKGLPDQTAVAMSGGGNALLAATPVNGGSAAAVWYLDGTRVVLDPPPGDCRPGDVQCWGRDLNADGSLIVGQARQCGSVGGFVWNRKAGFSSLGVGVAASGLAVSGDGKIIAGQVQIPGTEETTPALWQQGSAPENLLDSGARGTAVNISLDGRHVVGTVDEGHLSARGFIWSRDSGARILEVPSGHQADPTLVTAVSNRGVVVGSTGDEIAGNREALLWASTGGVQTVASFLADHGVTLPEGMTLTSAEDISSDSATIVGTCRDREYQPRFWMLQIEDPTLLGSLNGPEITQSETQKQSWIRPETDEADMLLPFPFGKRAHRKMPRP